MAEAKQYTFSFKELATLLVREQGIKEGHWGIAVRFGIQGANIGSSPAGNDLVPAAIVPVLEVGIQRFDSPNALTVDAEKVNPK
jgi:hypothetical protein